MPPKYTGCGSDCTFFFEGVQEVGSAKKGNDVRLALVRGSVDLRSAFDGSVPEASRQPVKREVHDRCRK